MEKLLAEFQEATKAGMQGIAAALERFAAGAVDEIRNAKPRAIAANPADEKLQLDEALFDSAPLLAVPKHAAFEPLKEIGHRFLATAEGIFVEVRRPWLHVIQLLSKLPENAPRPPYGLIMPKIELTFGRLGVAIPIIQAFAEEARVAAPDEHAAWIVWNSEAQKLEYKPLKIMNASPGAISFERPELPPHQSLAIDLHSHGRGEAFFSATDDKDDAGEVKIAGVLGGLGADDKPSVSFRLCVLGLTIPLKVPVEAIFKAAEPA
ncbi:PRTRC system protein A [Trinickia dinghuensis]|uniref:PRTRC system protein A n=1 Tax=Trinickia dinghuensis TaxID=2291023 RepID=A0A3D8K211_9BURK|nr:PRTRC system protein A [Trinickia dinghuensis]RDU99180.1 PRTRC system protein A [Trinickia dinghuensis]